MEGEGVEGVEGVEFTWRFVTARHLLQRGEPPQRSGLATQAKPACAGLKFISPCRWTLPM